MRPAWRAGEWITTIGVVIFGAGFGFLILQIGLWLSCGVLAVCW